MFKSTEEVQPERISKEVSAVEKNYHIQKNDLLSLEVYSNKGERLIDPNPELSQKNGTVQKIEEDEPVYLVDLKGTVRFPMVGEINLENFTLRQAEEILQKEYAKFFKEPYVQLTYKNKRVILLGALGGHVIPLENENMNLLEVLALGKGLTNDSKAQNIRLIRGVRVFEIDLSTIQGLRDGNVIVEPGDVIYVEPVRRPVSEALRDYSGALSLLISLTTLLLVLQSY
ncbi:MAG: polysaccharide biosynthesis/export family protein [Flammeovirgaceae bacterium]|nr:polysaccharide biosynthesis/export family protein [Flammeovirgaceae bacterium]